MRVARVAVAGLAAIAVTATPTTRSVAEEAAPADPHAHCREMAAKAALKRATEAGVDYKVPEVRLTREDGKSVTLGEGLADGRPVVLNFIYTTCNTICPVMTQTFAQLQKKLGDESGKVHMVSISIDPEFDTPARLAEYAKRFSAGPQWHFYTGTAQDSVAAQRAFDAFRGDKMSHTPVTFLRPASGSRWVRLDGFATSDELAAKVRELLVASR
ncbi:MAG: SCO family protein [Myxococcales bacterium]